METGDNAKQIVLIHAPADAGQVEELAKQLEPLEDAGKLRLWRPEMITAGEGMEEALQAALAQADMVLLWVSPDLWYGNPIYELMLRSRRLIPASAAIVPAIARASNWGEEPFLEAHAGNAIPVGHQPAPTEKGVLRDAWFAAAAREVVHHLGLPVRALELPLPFWKKRPAQLMIGAVFLLFAVFASIYLLNSKELEPEDSFSSERTAASPEEGAQTANASQVDAPSDSSKLYILIPRVEDFRSATTEEKSYGNLLVKLIDDIKARENLAIKISYRIDTAINQRDEARQMLEKNNADLLIWVKARNVSDRGRELMADIGWEPIPSRQLIEWAGGQLDKPHQSPYQENVSLQDVEEGALFMGEEEFEDWLIEMYNLKVGKKVPGFYYIKEDWPRHRKKEGYFNRGKNFFALNKYPEALSNALIAIGLDSSFAEGFYLSAKACYEMGKWEDGVAYCSHTIALDSLHKDAHNLRGLCYEALRQYPEAIEEYTTAIAIDPTYSAAYNNRGLVKKQTGDYEGAVEDYDSALVYDSLSYHAFTNRGVARSRLGYIQGAIADFDSAVAMGPAHEVVLTNRGYAHFLNQDYQRSIEDTNRAIEVKSDYANAWAVRGISRGALGDFEEALNDLGHALELHPESALYFYYRGQLYEDAEWFLEAAEDYRSALSIRKNYYKALLGYGRVNIRLRQPRQAALSLENAQKVRPDSAEVHYLLGRAYQMDKQFEQAAEQYEEAIRLDEWEPDYYRRLGHLHLRRARLRAALGNYWTAYTLAYPETWWYWLSLGIGGIILVTRAAWKKLQKHGE